MKNKTPILSVVVVTYNQLAFLKQTIKSIVDQDTSYYFELIVSDDCSTDGTKEYCESIPGGYSYDFKYVRMKENGGITANCNFGLIHAVGKYITLIGGDDLFLPLKIQNHINYMEANPDVVISYHPVDIFQSETNKTIFLTNQTNADSPRDVLEIIKNCIPGSVSVVVRATAVPKGGFDSRLPVVSDWLYYIEVASQGKVGFLKQTLARYRKHGNQASARTYVLLEESLRNLDLAKAKLHHIDGVDNAILNGKARYILGEAYRQFASGDKRKARMLIKRAIGYRRTFSAYGLMLFTYVMPSGSIIQFLKKIFKRFL